MSADLLAGARLAVIDLETAGLPAPNERILEIGLVEIENLTIVDTWTTLLNPGCPVPDRTLEALGIRRTDLLAAPAISEIAAGFGARLNQADAIVGHNVHFDLRILNLRFQALGVRGDHIHRALGDARLAALVLIEFASLLGEACRLEEFPGYIPDASVYPKPARTLPYQRDPAASEGISVRRNVAAAYRSTDRGGPETQHGEVMKVLIRSAAKSGREISLVTRRPGCPPALERAVPRGVDEVSVHLSDPRGGERWIPLEQIMEVRW